MSPWYPCGCCEEEESPCETGYPSSFSYDFSGDDFDSDVIESGAGGSWDVDSGEAVYSINYSGFTRNPFEGGRITTKLATSFADVEDMSQIEVGTTLINYTGTGGCMGIGFRVLTNTWYFGFRTGFFNKYCLWKNSDSDNGPTHLSDTIRSFGDEIKMVFEITSTDPTIDMDLKLYVDDVLIHTESDAESISTASYPFCNMDAFCWFAPTASTGTDHDAYFDDHFASIA